MAQTNTNVIIAFDETIFDELFFDVVVVVVVSNISTVLQ
jgi:low temperature requirement protein LtrA